MKRIALLLILVALVAGFAFGQVGDARTIAMGNAFTALADDVNAMYFNPGGIGFLKKSYLVVGADVKVGVTNQLVFGQQSLPDIYQDWDDQTQTDRWVYWDDFTNTQVTFDPANYGFPHLTDTTDPSYQQSFDNAVQEYEDYRTFYGAYETFTNLYGLGMVPRIAWQGKYIGLSTIYNITADLVTGDYDGADTPLTMQINKNEGVMVAGGLKLGFIGIGANFKYIQVKSDTLSYTAQDFQDGPPQTMVQDLIVGSPNQVDITSRYELGLGTIVALGPFNVGAYIDNLLFFINPTSGSVNFGDLFNTMSVGASWTPFSVKTADKHGLLNLIASADLKNFGSVINRQLALGAEVGLNLGDVITLNLRGGYVQPLPGTLAEMTSSFDPKIGMYSVGIGAKFLFASIDMAAILPADIVLDPPQPGNISADRLASPFARFVVNASISF